MILLKDYGKKTSKTRDLNTYVQHQSRVFRHRSNSAIRIEWEIKDTYFNHLFSANFSITCQKKPSLPIPETPTYLFRFSNKEQGETTSPSFNNFLSSVGVALG